MAQGVLLNYKELPGKLVRQLVPDHFHQDISGDVAARMLAVSTKYSMVCGGLMPECAGNRVQARGNEQDWVPDSMTKQSILSAHVCLRCAAVCDR